MLTCKYTSARLTVICHFSALNFNGDNNLHDKEILSAQKKHFRKIKKGTLLKGGKEKQKTQDGMWVFGANGLVRQPHTSAFASLPFCKCFYSLK